MCNNSSSIIIRENEQWNNERETLFNLILILIQLKRSVYAFAGFDSITLVFFAPSLSLSVYLSPACAPFLCLIQPYLLVVLVQRMHAMPEA